MKIACSRNYKSPGFIVVLATTAILGCGEEKNSSQTKANDASLTDTEIESFSSWTRVLPNDKAFKIEGHGGVLVK